MEASIVDLRYKMNDVLKALERKERVKILYHGKVKGVIVPSKQTVPKKVKDHLFFGMTRNERESVQVHMSRLRASRT